MIELFNRYYTFFTVIPLMLHIIELYNRYYTFFTVISLNLHMIELIHEKIK